MLNPSTQPELHHSAFGSSSHPHVQTHHPHPPPPPSTSPAAPAILPAGATNPSTEPISAYFKLEFPGFSYYLQTLSVSIGRRTLPPNPPAPPPLPPSPPLSTSSSLIVPTAPSLQPPPTPLLPSPFEYTGQDANQGIDVDLGAIKSVSRLHARISYDDESGCFVLDVFGRNGAWVEDEYFAKGQRAVLNERTKIQISIRTFTFVLPPSPSPPPSTPLGLPEFTYADDSGPLSPATYALLEAIAENPDNALLGELDELDLGVFATAKPSKGKGKASGGKISGGNASGGGKSSGGKGKATGFGAKMSGGKINGGGKAPSSVRPPVGVHVGGGKASHHAVPPRASGGKRASAAKEFHHEDSDGSASASDSSISSGSSSSSSSASSAAASLSRKMSSSRHSSGSSSSASSSSSLSSSSHSSSSGSSSEDDQPLAQASLLKPSSKTNRPRATKSPYLAGPSPIPVPTPSPSIPSASLLLTQSYPLPPPVPITAVAPPPRSPPPLPPTMPPSTKTKTKTKTKLKKEQTDKTKTKSKAKSKASKTTSGLDAANNSSLALSSMIPSIPQSQLEESAVEEDIKPTFLPVLTPDPGQESNMSTSVSGQASPSAAPSSSTKTKGKVAASVESFGSFSSPMDVDSPNKSKDMTVTASQSQLASTTTPTTAGKKPPAAKKTPAPRRSKTSSTGSISISTPTTIASSTGQSADVKPTLPILSYPSDAQTPSHSNHSSVVQSALSTITKPSSPSQNPPKTPVSTSMPPSDRPNSTSTDSTVVIDSAGNTSTKHIASSGVSMGRGVPSPLSQSSGSGPVKQLSQPSASLGSPLNSASTIHTNVSTGKPAPLTGPASRGVQPASTGKPGQIAPSVLSNGTGISTTPMTARSVGGPAGSSVNLPSRVTSGSTGTNSTVGTGPNRSVSALGGGAKPLVANTSILRQAVRPQSLPSLTNHPHPISPSITTGPTYRPQVPLTSAEILGGSTSHRPIPSHTHPSSNMSSTGRSGSQMPISSSTILSQQAALLHHHQIHYGSTSGSNSGSGSASASSTAAHMLSASTGNFQSPSPTASASVSPPSGIRRTNSNSSSNLGLPPTRPLHANPLSALIPMGQTTEEGEAAKPPLTYNTAILLSLQSFEGNQGTLRMICDWIMNEFEWYRVNKNSGWQNSLRHTLSTNEAFQKVPLRPDQPKNAGAYWKLDPACEGALMATAESEIKNRVSKQEKMRKAKEKEMGKDGKIGSSSTSGVNVGQAGPGGIPSLAVPDAYPSNGVGRLAGKPISVGDNVLHKPLAIPSSLGNQPSRPLPTTATAVGRPPPAGGGSTGTGGPPLNGGRTLTISPNTRLPLLVSPIPAHLQTTPPHRLLESTPMAMYQGSLLLDPAIFSHVPRPQLDYLESLGQEKALKILRAYIVDHLKAKLDAQGKSGGAGSTAGGGTGGTGGVRPGGTPTNAVGRPPPIRPSVGGAVRPSNPTSTVGTGARPPLSVRPAVGRPINTRPPPPRPAASTVRPVSSAATSATTVRPLVQPRPAPTLPGVPADPRAALSAYASNPQLGLAGLGPHAGAFFQYLSSIGDKADLNVAAQLIKTGRAPGVPLYVPPLLQGKLTPRSSGVATTAAGSGTRTVGPSAGVGAVRPVRPATTQARPPGPSVRPVGSVAARPSLQLPSGSAIVTPTKAGPSSTLNRAPVTSTPIRPTQPATSTNISRPLPKNQSAPPLPTSTSTSTSTFTSTSTISSTTSAITSATTATAVAGVGSTPTSYVPSLDDLAAVLSMSPSSEAPSPAPTPTPTPTSASTTKVPSAALLSSTNTLSLDKMKVEKIDTSAVAMVGAGVGTADGQVKRKAEEEGAGTEEKKPKVE
ncbi:Transcription factor of the Forkhead/HNF3 family [Phaffia rhodozyma]|uniref:Transcription factor of the Forkhead/HNF3 family n=1 Tax=Phaffia rhodozyma TaxID=264483 RepID=A0A0F7STP3_PHARH|nr:Transcription factor of the Forkhead/HNF3 family [Phaffia rhodozyma]